MQFHKLEFEEDEVLLFLCRVKSCDGSYKLKTIATNADKIDVVADSEPKTENRHILYNSKTGTIIGNASKGQKIDFVLYLICKHDEFYTDESRAKFIEWGKTIYYVSDDELELISSIEDTRKDNTVIYKVNGKEYFKPIYKVVEETKKISAEKPFIHKLVQFLKHNHFEIGTCDEWYYKDTHIKLSYENFNNKKKRKLNK